MHITSNSKDDVMEEFKLQAQAYWNADKVVNQFSSAKAADYISHFLVHLMRRPI